MNRKHFTFMTFGIFFIAASVHGATTPETVNINLQQSNPPLAKQWQDKKEVKEFSHKAHIDIMNKLTPNQNACLTCHKEVVSSEELLGEDRQEKQRTIIIAAGGVKKYMHSNCLTCHKTLKKQKVTTGPTSCKGCH